MIVCPLTRTYWLILAICTVLVYLYTCIYIPILYRYLITTCVYVCVCARTHTRKWMYVCVYERQGILITLLMYILITMYSVMIRVSLFVGCTQILWLKRHIKCYCQKTDWSITKDLYVYVYTHACMHTHTCTHTQTHARTPL